MAYISYALMVFSTMVDNNVLTTMLKELFYEILYQYEFGYPIVDFEEFLTKFLNKKGFTIKEFFAHKGYKQFKTRFKFLLLLE